MSTTIYNGIKFKETNIYNIYEQLHDFKKIVVNYHKEKEIQKIIRLAIVEYAKEKFLYQKEIKEDILFKYLLRRMDDLRENNNKNNIFNKINENIIIFPYKENIYGIYYGELLEIFLNYDIAQEFGYWNNTDKPEGISLNSWNKRSVIWDNIFKKNSSPKEVGFSFELFDSEQIIITMEDIKKNYNKYILSKAEIIKILLPEILLKNMEKTSKENLSNATIIKILNDSIKTQEFLELKKTITKDLENNIKDISIDLLTNKETSSKNNKKIQKN